MSHICIIEDDAAIAEIERDYLEINGFTVSIATDGVSGLNLTQKESFAGSDAAAAGRVHTVPEAAGTSGHPNPYGDGEKRGYRQNPGIGSGRR